MQQQNLGFNANAQKNNQQLYMQAHDMQVSGAMPQNYQHLYQPNAGNPVNQQSYLLHPQSINNHTLYAQQFQMQPQTSQQQQFQPYQRTQQQFGGQFYSQSSQQQQYWNANQQFQPQIPLPQQPVKTLNQNLSPSMKDFAPQRDLGQNLQRGNDQFKNSEFYPRDVKTETAPRSNSPTHEETGEGYFLPDFIANELDGQSPSSQLVQKMFKQGNQKQGSIIGDELESQPTQDNSGDLLRAQGFQMPKRICQLCNSETNPYEQVVERISEQTRQPYYTHLSCLTNHSLGQVHDSDDSMRMAPSSQLIRGLSSTISPQPKSILSIPLTPDMLLFDFQLLHPMTQTNIFSLSNQSANYIFDQQNSTFLYNKLLCNATAVPFNMAVVKLRWDFLRDPAQIVDPYSNSNTLLPNLPQGQYSNMIQGLINFNDMQNHNDKNITITLKAQPQEQTFLQLNPSNNPMLHLNFNYSNFQEQSYEMQQHQIPKHFLPVTHIIKNLYLSFVLSTKDFEILKEDTLKLLQQNPSLISLLKPSQPSIQAQQRFVSTQPGSSLHSLFQGAQDNMYSPLSAQMQKLNINQNPLLSPANLSIQQNYNSPLNTQEYYRSSPKGSTFSARLENQGSERTLPIDSLQTQTMQARRMPSEGLKIAEEFKRGKKERRDEPSNIESPAEENQSLRKALTCNFEVSTFEGENKKKMAETKIGLDQAQSVGGSPKQNFIGDSSPTFLSTGGSARHLFGNDNEDKGDFLNPSAIQKQRTLKAGSSKKDENRKGSGGSVGSKKSKKSSGSLRSGGSSSKSASSARVEDFDTESAQIITELKGQVVETARQQHGSKYLQKLLARASPDFVGFAIDESIYHLHELMVDQYGNYFCQKLLQSSSSAQRHRILQVLSPNILKISCDRKGTHAMQCLIEMVNMPDEEEALKNGIKDHVIDLAFDANGTHVLQKVMLCMKEENIDFIFNPVYENLIELSMDQNGLCVIKKIIAKIQGHDKRMKIGQKLSEHVVELVQSPYGNYAVQQALDNWPIQYCESIFEKLEPHLMQLSVQKFSSNVIEKVLENATYDTVEKYLKALCEHEVMKSLIKNTYGFYVIQKLKEVVKRHGKSMKRIYQAIENTIQYVSDKSLRQKWQQLMTQS